MSMLHTYDEWEIIDDNGAEWAIQRIVEAQSDTAKWEAHYKAQLEKIAQRNQETIDFMTAKLRQYFDTVPHKKTKTQESYVLPSAKLVFKMQPPAFSRDEAQLLPWVKQNAPKLVKVAESTDWAALKKRITLSSGSIVDAETGEVIPGVIAEERPPVFQVSVKEE